MTDRQQQDALVAAVWLAMQPVESVKPGGEINSAIKSKTHGRLLDEFQFAITPEFKEEIPRLFAQAAGMEFQEEAASEAASEDSGEDEVGLTVGTELTVGTGDSDGGCEACQ
ncbi:MAG: hypothetical protein EBV03_08800 [Proteobacteria bacterium]|nr:hypothetical protein [Pseudomonadota bacterium]